MNNLFNDVSDNNWHFEWDIDDSFDFFDPFYFNNFFGDFLHCDNLRYFNNSVNNFLYNFFNFNDLWNNSEDLEDVINFNNTHDFLSDHSNNSFIHLKNNTSFEFDFFEFFKKGLDQDSQVEFNFSGLFTGVSVNVFDFDNLWYILNDFNQSINFVDFDNIDNLLLEEFHQFSVHF